ncbi:MAG TPA: hypothetical protein VJM49_21720 [Acidimicrobiales bacterium]|nr:hypothetical protein [Acidimicrobiales bacterium]
MFSVHCPRHGREILLDSGRIRGLDTTSDGIVLTWECWCGHVGTNLTGRPAHPAPAARPTSPASAPVPADPAAAA